LADLTRVCFRESTYLITRDGRPVGWMFEGLLCCLRSSEVTNQKTSAVVAENGLALVIRDPTLDGFATRDANFIARHSFICARQIFDLPSRAPRSAHPICSIDPAAMPKGQAVTAIKKPIRLPPLKVLRVRNPNAANEGSPCAGALNSVLGK
jgi:hypothetical protein